MNGFIYGVNAKDFTFSAYDDIKIRGNFNYVLEDLNNLNVWQTAIGCSYVYSGDLITDDIKQFSLQNADELQKHLYWNSEIKTKKEIQVNKSPNEFLFRTDQAPDLDGNNFCGLYKSSKSDTYYAIGSWVCGVENDESFGKFIGVNNRYINAMNTSNDPYFYENSFEIGSPQPTGYNSRNYYNEYCILGKTYDLQIPKYLVHWNVKGYDQPYRCNRYFIIEGTDLILAARKFWYCDLENSTDNWVSSPAQFFRGMIYANYQAIHKVTFKYINLDDPSDIKDDIEFSNIRYDSKKC